MCINEKKIFIHEHCHFQSILSFKWRHSIVMSRNFRRKSLKIFKGKKLIKFYARGAMYLCCSFYFKFCFFMTFFLVILKINLAVRKNHAAATICDKIFFFVNTQKYWLCGMYFFVQRQTCLALFTLFVVIKIILRLRIFNRNYNF